MIKEEFSVLFAHVDDLCARAERGELGATRFLSPKEQYALSVYLNSHGFRGRYIVFGGYVDAERCRVFILPEYIENAETYGDISPYIEDKPISAIRIVGSGYRKLTHRDFLGSLLALGIERDVVGDIVVRSGEKDEAVVFCDGVIEEFLLAELKRIANDAVKTETFTVSDDFVSERRFLHISDTVASARLDCIVAAICSLSREKARAAIISGLVEVNFENETAPDKNLSVPAVVSVRGYGKFRINSVSDITRKGRLRLDADKYL